MNSNNQQEKLTVKPVKRGKTPSGTIVSLSVNNIKHIFESANKTHSSGPDLTCSTLTNCERVQANVISQPKNFSAKNKVSEVQKGKGLQRRSTRKSKQLTKSHGGSSAIDEDKVNSECESGKESDNYFTPPATPARIKQTRQPLITTKIKRMSGQEEVNQEKSMQQDPRDSPEMEKEASIDELLKPGGNDACFDMQMIHACFKRLEAKVDAMAATKTKEEEEEMQKRIEKLEQHAVNEEKATDENIEKRLRGLEVGNYHADAKMGLISGTIQHLHDVVADLTKRVENVEINTTRKHMTISGLRVEGKKDVMIREVEAFIAYELNLYVHVEDAYKLGEADPPQIVFILQNLQDKFDILRNRSKLKGVQYDREQPFYINEYFPMATNEKKRWEREIQKYNDARPAEEQLEIEFQKGKMIIDGKEYNKAVHVPTPDDILDLQIDQYDEILQSPMSQKGQLQEKDSLFIAYTKSCQTHQEVQQGYLKVRLLHPKARHVVCAYHIQEGMNEDWDGCDDQEYGAFRSILQVMRENEIKSRAFYVVRFCGVQKLSSRRFQCYAEAAKLALIQSPLNVHIGKEQKISSNFRRNALTAEQAKKQSNNRGTRGNRELNNKESYGRGGVRGGRGSRNRGSGGRRPRNASQWRRNNYTKPPRGTYAAKLMANRKRMRSPDSMDDENRKSMIAENSTTEEEMEVRTENQENWSAQNNGEWNSQDEVE